jgi:hypothetical protein
MSDTNTPAASTVEPNKSDKDKKLVFDDEIIKKYPRSNKKIAVDVHKFGLDTEEDNQHKGHTSFISPYGLQFQGTNEYEEGSLLKIHLAIPDYWTRKQRFVDYQRIDSPDKFKLLAKVVRIEDIGKRGRKKMVTVQVVNIDDIDEQVLKSYLQDG